MEVKVTARIILDFTVTVDAESVEDAKDGVRQADFGLLSGYDDYPHSCGISDIEITSAEESSGEIND